MCLPVSVFVLGLRAGVGDEGENGTTRGVETIIRFAPSRSVELGARLIRVERLRAVLLLLDIAVRRRLPKLRANLNLRRRGKSYVPGRAGPFSPAPLLERTLALLVGDRGLTPLVSTLLISLRFVPE